MGSQHSESYLLEDSSSNLSSANFSINSNSNDTQILEQSLDSTVAQTSQSKPAFFEYDSILFPKSKLIDYNINNNKLLINEEETVLANEPKKESKKEKKLVRAISQTVDEDEAIRLTIMSLELHVNTRANLTPNPDVDSIGSICFSIFEYVSNETANSERKIETHLVVLVDSKRQSSIKNHHR